MPGQPARTIALFWFSLITIVIIALVGVVTLTADQPASVTRLTQTRPPVTVSPTHRVSLTPSSTAIPLHSATPTLTTTHSNTATSSPAYLQCAWQWASEPLPEMTQQVQDWLTEAEFRAGVFAEAYGENCLDYRSGTPAVAYFAAMTTDFHLNIYSLTLTNAPALAESYMKAYELLVEFSAEADLPARLGYLTVTFNAPGYFTTVRAMFSEVEALLDNGLTGQSLLEALGAWPVTPIPQPT
ncbi:MAG: hypothetical protein J0M33_19980 [Anaerolineae bacterium]|nr:hypothetical protein [Anaerolineae bacterium]